MADINPSQTSIMIQRFNRAIIVVAIAFCLCLPGILSKTVIAQGNASAAGAPATPTATAPAAQGKSKAAAEESLLAVIFSGGIMGIGIMIVLILLSIF